MKKEKYQSLPLAEKLLRLKQNYLLGKYQELIIHDEYIYPPIQKDIKEILVSQFGVSILDQYIRNYSEEKLNKKNKFPLPIIFAFIHHHLKSNKYENLIRIIMQHVDRKGVEHYYILLYIIAKIYEKFKQYKKSIFYLENLLKESPFFSEGLYDLCYHYAMRFQREQEACSILERHIGHCPPKEKHIHSLYIYVCSKFKIRNPKDVAKVLHNKSMNLVAYFNLGLYLRQNEELEKAHQIFTEIIAKLSKAKTDQTVIFTQKDEKILLLSKINLLLILKNQNFQRKESPNQIQSYSKLIINEHSSALDTQTLIKLSQYNQIPIISNVASLKSLKSQKIFKNCYSTRKSKQLSTIKYKQEKTSQNQQKSIENKQNLKLNSFNSEFSTIREYNNKKLKYLLEKQKEINHFFKNIVIKKDSSSDKMQIEYKIREKLIKPQQNQLSIIKTKVLNSDEFQFFQKQFESKRKLHQFKYDNIELESMLTQIVTNFQNCVAENQKQKKPVSCAKNYAQPSKAQISKQSLQPSKYIPSQAIPKSSHCSRKSDKHEKPIASSQITSRGLKSDRGGLFRIKYANKQAKDQKEEKQQILLNEGKANIILPSLQKPRQQNKLEPIPQRTIQVIKEKQNSAKKIINQIKQSQNPMIFGEEEQEQSFSQKQVSTKNQEYLVENQEQVLQAKIKELEQNPTIESNQQAEKLFRRIITQQLSQHQQQSAETKQNLFKELEQPQKNKQASQIKEQNSKKQVQAIQQLKQSPRQEQNNVDNQNKNEQKQQQANQQLQKAHSPSVPEPTICQKQQEKQTPNQNSTEKPPAYDPFASSFQLTGFGKASLSKFREQKKTRTNESRQSMRSQDLPPGVQMLQIRTDQVKVGKAMNHFEQEIQQGQQLQAAREYQKAYQLYTRLYKTYKKESQKQVVLIKIANLFQRQEKYAEAEKTYLKCTKFNNVEAFLKLGALLLKNGRINSGVENIEKANCLKRNDVQIQNKLVYGYSLRQETMEKALNLAQIILKKQPQSLETLIITANILQKQGKIKEAIQIMTAIDKFKSAQYIKHYLGILYLQDSNLTEAFNHFKAALSIKADYLPSLIEVATIISEISPKQSISILQKVLQIEPHNRKALARLGKIYESIENDFQNAMVAYQTALETQQNYESYMKIGDCLARQESYIEALINYKEALNLRKTHQAYAKVANMFQMKDEYTKAIENYEQALDMLIIQKQGGSAKRKQYLTYLGNLSIKIGNYDAGIKFFEDIDDYEDSIQILKLLAEAYFGKKQYSIALEKYEKANEIAHGQNIQVLENIAICFDKMEEYLASKAIYQKILEKDPENIRCMNNLANILLITGETNQSFYLFESMLQKAPKNLEKRLKVVDIYAEVGDWSKVEFHLLHCLRQKENDERVIERLVNLYKQKRDIKMANKYEKKLAIIRSNRKAQQKAIPTS